MVFKVCGFVSENHTVKDCLFMDYKSDGTKNTGWIKSTNAQVIEENGGATVSATSESTYRCNTLITGDFEIVFEATITGGSIRFSLRNESNQYSQALFNTADLQYYKIKRVGSTISMSSSTDGITWNSRSLELSNVGSEDCYFLFRIQIPQSSQGIERSIFYKNFRIYPI